MSAEPHHWWQAQIPGRDGSVDRLVVVDSARYADGERVALSAEAARTEIGVDAVCEASLESGVVQRLSVGAEFVDGLPPIWYAELVEPDTVRPATTLVAFIEAGQPPGALIDEAHLAHVWVDSDDQLGAIRWFPETGQVDQIYVAPSRRRQGLGSALIAAAATLNVARDLPRLWGSGHRTELGERLLGARSWRARTLELSELAPPMTPSE